MTHAAAGGFGRVGARPSGRPCGKSPRAGRHRALGKVEVGPSISGRSRPADSAFRGVALPAHAPCEGLPMRYTRFEKARIIGARALQISMGSPILLDVPGGMVDPIEIAWLEFDSGAIPITVKRDAS